MVHLHRLGHRIQIRGEASMKKRLRVKFAILYALFALLSFLAVSTFGMSLARKYVTKSVADDLYQDARRIASGSLIQSYMKSLSSREDL